MASTLTTPFPIQKSTITFGPDPIYGLLYDLFSGGVGGAADMQVVQHAAGANYTVDVGSGTAYVPSTQALDLRRVRNTAVSNAVGGNTDWAAVFTTADPTNPRVDTVVLIVNDANIDASGLYTATFKVLTGTPAIGATLANLTGKAAAPANSILLAYVLIPALATTIPTANIRDARAVFGTKSSGPLILNDPAGTSPLPNTTWPSSPFDGQEVSVLVDIAGNSPAVFAAAGCAIWTFRYSAAMAAIGSPPWQFVGGPPLIATVATSESLATTTFGDLATVGPSIVVPRTGQYNIDLYSRIANATAGNGGMVAPTSTTLGAANANNSVRLLPPAAASAWAAAGIVNGVTLTKAETLKLQYAAQGGATAATFDNRRLRLTPVAVS